MFWLKHVGLTVAVLLVVAAGGGWAFLLGSRPSTAVRSVSPDSLRRSP